MEGEEHMIRTPLQFYYAILRQAAQASKAVDDYDLNSENAAGWRAVVRDNELAQTHLIGFCNFNAPTLLAEIEAETNRTVAKTVSA